jgi:hypothetical protein
MRADVDAPQSHIRNQEQRASRSMTRPLTSLVGFRRKLLVQDQGQDHHYRLEVHLAQVGRQQRGATVTSRLYPWAAVVPSVIRLFMSAARNRSVSQPVWWIGQPV